MDILLRAIVIVIIADFIYRVAEYIISYHRSIEQEAMQADRIADHTVSIASDYVCN